MPRKTQVYFVCIMRKRTYFLCADCDENTAIYTEKKTVFQFLDLNENKSLQFIIKLTDYSSL